MKQKLSLPECGSVTHIPEMFTALVFRQPKQATYCHLQFAAVSSHDAGWRLNCFKWRCVTAQVNCCSDQICFDCVRLFVCSTSSLISAHAAPPQQEKICLLSKYILLGCGGSKLMWWWRRPTWNWTHRPVTGSSLAKHTFGAKFFIVCCVCLASQSFGCSVIFGIVEFLPPPPQTEY